MNKQEFENDFESWMVKIGKQYLADHPNEKLKITKKVEIPVNECEYCKEDSEPIFGIPFSDTCIQVRGAEIAFFCSCGFGVSKNINFCPMCGRKLNDTK